MLRSGRLNNRRIKNSTALKPTSSTFLLPLTPSGRSASVFLQADRNKVTFGAIPSNQTALWSCCPRAGLTARAGDFEGSDRIDLGTEPSNSYSTPAATPVESCADSMVQLLNLPFEMLERILQYTLRPDFEIRSRWERIDLLPAVSQALALRTVHSCFRAALDPFVFRRISYRMHPGNGYRYGSSDGSTPGLQRILTHRPLATHVRSLMLHFDVSEMGNNAQKKQEQVVGYMTALGSLLQDTAKTLTSLKIWGACIPGGASPSFSAWTGAGTFMCLSNLALFGSRPARLLPFIAQVAPNLMSLEICGFSANDKDYKDLIADWKDRAMATRLPIRPFHHLHIRDFEGDWAQEIIHAMGLQAVNIVLSMDAFDKLGAPHQYRTAACESLLAYDGLAAIRFLPNYGQIYVPQCDYKTAEMQSAKLFDHFREQGEGRTIVLSRKGFKQGWEQVLSQIPFYKFFPEGTFADYITIS